MPLSRNSGVGLVVAVVSALILGWSLAGKPDPLSHHRVVWAQFRDSAGIAKFDRDVRVAGVNVGTVGRIERHGDVARVQLRLRDDVARAVRADATAELRPHTLFDGSAYVELHPGSASAPPLGPTGIPLSRTHGYVTLDKALRTFDPDVRAAVPALARDLRAALRGGAVPALRSTFSRAPKLLGRAAVAFRALQGTHRTELAASVAGLARTVDGVAASRADIGPLLRSADTTVAAVDHAAGPLDTTLATLPAALRQSRVGAAALDRTLVALRPLVADLGPAFTAARRTLVHVQPLLRELPPVLLRARPLLRELRGVLAAGRRAAPAATALLRALRPTLNLVEHQLLPFLREKTRAGSTVGRGLAAVASSAAGTLSPVKTVAEGGKEGAGHVFYLNADTGTQVGCGQLDANVAAVMQELALCTP